jgi:shikimate dehydrogenase
MKLAVVGNPIEHSKSPLIFRFLFDAVNLEYSYEKLLLNSAQEIPELFENGYTGLSITAPFKQSVIPLLDELSEEARAIGSVNTVVLKEGKLFGYNTDWIGVSNALIENGIDLTDKKSFILGAGGAARAAVYAMKNKKASVQLYNRSEHKAKHLAEEFGGDFIQENDIQKSIANADILIDTLPAGVKLLKSDWLHKGLTILDASYPKSVYEGYNIAQLIGGENWLLYQALPAFKLFTGIELNNKEYNHQVLLNMLIKT